MFRVWEWTLIGRSEGRVLVTPEPWIKLCSHWSKLFGYRISFLSCSSKWCQVLCACHEKNYYNRENISYKSQLLDKLKRISLWIISYTKHFIMENFSYIKKWIVRWITIYISDSITWLYQLSIHGGSCFTLYLTSFPSPPTGLIWNKVHRWYYS